MNLLLFELKYELIMVQAVLEREIAMIIEMHKKIMRSKAKGICA